MSFEDLEKQLAAWSPPAEGRNFELHADVRVVERACRAGCYDTGKRFVASRLRFEGTLRAAWSLPDVDAKLQVAVSVDVEFTANDESADTSSHGVLPPYVGFLQVWSDDTSGGAMHEARLALALPSDVQQHFMGFESLPIDFRAIGDIITEPNEAQLGDRVVAFVKRVRLQQVIAGGS